MILDILTLGFVLSLVWMTYPNQRRKYIQQLESENAAFKQMLGDINTTVEASEIEKLQLVARVEGLELERETLEREARRYKEEMETCKKRLIARGLA